MTYLLMTADTSEPLRPATIEEFKRSQASREAGDNGVIETQEGLVIAIDPIIVEPVESIGSVTRALSAEKEKPKC